MDKSKLNPLLLAVTIVIILVIVIIAIVKFSSPSTSLDLDTSSSSEAKIDFEQKMKNISQSKDDSKIELNDELLYEIRSKMFVKKITNWNYKLMGKTEKSVSFPNVLTASGGFKYENDRFLLYATFLNLPKLTDGQHYEGWLVKNDPFEYIPLGKLNSLENGTYDNTYASSKDYTDYNTYVLTLESDDNSDPDTVVIEGTIK